MLSDSWRGARGKSPSKWIDAGKWIIPERDQHNDLKAVNLLGYAYSIAPDGPEKEQKLVQILEKFHGYLMKYLCMIVRGDSSAGEFLCR